VKKKLDDQRQRPQQQQQQQKISFSFFSLLLIYDVQRTERRNAGELVSLLNVWLYFELQLPPQHNTFIFNLREIFWKKNVY
jgi:hypothetical protein